jgi:hypothetical protein
VSRLDAEEPAARLQVVTATVLSLFYLRKKREYNAIIFDGN